MNLSDNGVNTGNNNQMLNRSLAFLGGVTIGSVAALLFAPKKGSESRKQIKDKFNDAASRIRNRMGIAEEQRPVMAAVTPGEINLRNFASDTRASKTKQNNEDAHASKAQSMVSHLKHTKKDNSADYVD